eukprot:CAMPEP_0113872960 /NCGR_PEP_ID=MMETSP0780_2-20120614/3506_1 /TAXON_ID=652834 /ORGANISM="Palpitomonas bilix" /LENGTH=299 /DNA_ID=CAMNT_0000858555 /DNA_START=152 /DNA_END=1051 /DNA_ORIENTATION=- /assembly_acc=CAM_ASM_000599
MEGGGADPLFQLKTNFYVGNYQAAINHGNSAKVSSEHEKIERDVFIYRSYIAMKNYTVVMDEISDDAHPSLLAVKLYASYKFSDDGKDVARVTLKEWGMDPQMSSNATFKLIVALISIEEEKFEDALKAIHDFTALEHGLQLVYVYIKMNRIDLAEKQVRAMVEMDEDSAVTQIAIATFNLAFGGEKIQEAYYIFQDLADKNSVSTPLLLNGMACAQMLMENFDEAEGFLTESLGKVQNDESSLINMIACSSLMRKPDAVSNRYASQLKGANANSAFFTTKSAMEEAFDVAVASLPEKA